MDELFSRAQKSFTKAEKILLLTHQKPDGDALGSVLSLLLYLRRQGKQAEAIVVDPVPSYLNFLPAIEELGRDYRLIDKLWDLLVVVDAGDWNYTGLSELEQRGIKTINIDHHATNQFFGDLNLVDARASSTCEIIYRFLSFVKADIDRQAAVCLLCGILNDTGGFSNSATNSLSIGIAGELLKSGAKINKISDSVIKNKSLEGLRLWGLILSRLSFNRKLNLVFTYIKEEELRRYRVSEEEINGLVNFLNSLSGVDLAAFFRLGPEQTKVSLRTNKDNIDLAKLASFFGGGGHRKAAGFVWPRPLVENGGKLSVG